MHKNTIEAEEEDMLIIIGIIIMILIIIKIIIMIRMIMTVVQDD